MSKHRQAEVVRAQQELRAYADKVRPVDAPLADACLRLADRVDMARVWQELGGGSAETVVGSLALAATRARAEARLPTRADTKRDLGRLRRAARELQAALATSALPKIVLPVGNRRPGESVGMNAKVWMAVSRRRVTELGPTVYLPELLDLVVEHVDLLEKASNPRAVSRATKDPFSSAFVRWFNLLLVENAVNASPGVLATIINAATDESEDPWTDERVKAVLRDQPQEFKGPKRSGRSP